MKKKTDFLHKNLCKDVRVHLIAIGGIGMAGLARLYLQAGYQVSGSDIQSNDQIEALKKMGATVYIGHQADHVLHASHVIYSSSIKTDNPEYQAAMHHNIPCLHRADALSQWLACYDQSIAVSGTHGKTTTTALLAHALMSLNANPGYYVGAVMLNSGQTADIGSLESISVCEADESDASFLQLKHDYALITNIDQDHMQTYHHQVQELTKAFLTFIHQIPEDGLAVLCADDPMTQQIIPFVNRAFRTYGLQESAQIRGSDIQSYGHRTHFIVHSPNEMPQSCSLPLMGNHNVCNALGVLAILQHLGYATSDIIRSFDTFLGTRRRLEYIGRIPLAGQWCPVFDDYGHHPTEIQSTYQAVCRAWPKKKWILIFQPHRYTRLQDLMNEFLKVLSEIEYLVLLPVYAAGENPIPGVTSFDLYMTLKSMHPHIYYIEKFEDFHAILNHFTGQDCGFLTQGAGHIHRLTRDWMHSLDAVFN